MRNRWAFDHVAIDIGYFCAVAGRFTRDLIGSDRDSEAVKIVQKQVQYQVLRRLGSNKSLALMMDGSEPLWKVQHARLHPGKKFPEKFYRSAASPMVYLLEEKLCALGPELRPQPVEYIVSGAGVPGPAEGKISAWVLDLATRIPHAATNPPGVPSVTANDSLCIVGHTDLFLSVLGATPFHNVTAVTFNAGEIKSFSLRDCMEWLRLGELLEPVVAATPTSTVDGGNAQQQKLAAARTDVVLLYLMANGISSTNLPAFSVSFSDLMDGYREELRASAPSTVTTKGADGGVQRFFSGVLFDEFPLVASPASSPSSPATSATLLPSLRLKPDALARVLARAAKRPVVFPSRPCPVSANYLEVLLQSHAMLTSGGIQNYGWVPSNSEAGVPEKPPKVSLDQLVGHLRAAAAASASSSSPSSSSSPDASSPPASAYIFPTRSRSFALTGLESLLLTSPEAAIIDQVVPMFARGHTMPAGVSQGIADTKNVFAALDKTRATLGGLVASAASSSFPHPAITHSPTHYLVRAAGVRGPPSGWLYNSINMGLKAEAMNIRYSLNASDTAFVLRDLTTASPAESGISKRNYLHVFDESARSWREVPCEEIHRLEGSEGKTAAAVSTLRVLTWNTQFDRHSGERTPLGRTGIDWCSRTRYLALSKVLEASDADVVAMQEVEPAWCAFLAKQPWVQQGYGMSCHEGSHAISPWGVLMLVRRTLPVMSFTHANVAAFSGHTSAMPEVTVNLGAGSSPVTIGSMHLLAPYSQNNVNNRDTQLSNLVKHFQTPGSSGGAARIVMGDFNDFPTKAFHFPAELGFKDAWKALHPRCDEIPPPSARGPDSKITDTTEEDAEERGYTINGVANPYAGKIIEPEFFGRADRVMYAANQLQPVHAELVGTAPVLDVLKESGVTHLVERPQERIPDYLFPSDHFGVLVEFQVV